MDKNLDKFIEMSELVSNTNKVINKAEIEQIIHTKQYEYINLNFTDSFNSTKIVEKDGIDNALVEANLAIAETGTVVLSNGSEEFRRATSLCENLDVVVPLSRIVKSLDDTAGFIKEATSKESGGYVAFITGASRTADIEMSLSLGVHGPQTMNVFIIKDL